MKSAAPRFRLVFAAALLVTLGCPLLLLLPPRAGAQAEPHRHFALIIGNNGYQHVPRLKTAEDDAREIDVLTVFRDRAMAEADGDTPTSYLLALSHTLPGSAAARATSKLFFLRYDFDKWSDVTDAILPVPVDPHLTYELPRIGTTISVTNRAGAKVYDLVWELMSGRFVHKR